MQVLHLLHYATSGNGTTLCASLFRFQNITIILEYDGFLSLFAFLIYVQAVFTLVTAYYLLSLKITDFFLCLIFAPKVKSKMISKMYFFSSSPFVYLLSLGRFVLVANISFIMFHILTALPSQYPSN